MWCLYQGHTLVQLLPNCLRHILITGICDSSANTGHNNLRGAHYFILSSLSVGLHSLLQENPHRTQINWCRCHHKWWFCKSQSVLLTAESRFYLGGIVKHVWDEMECWFLHQHEQPSAIYFSYVHECILTALYCAVFVLLMHVFLWLSLLLLLNIVRNNGNKDDQSSEANKSATAEYRSRASVDCTGRLSRMCQWLHGANLLSSDYCTMRTQLVLILWL